MNDYVCGRFGSLHCNILVLKTKTSDWYVVHVENEDIQWDWYCNDARLIPVDDGKLTEVECNNETKTCRVWKIPKDNYIKESCRIASLINQ